MARLTPARVRLAKQLARELFLETPIAFEVWPPEAYPSEGAVCDLCRAPAIKHISQTGQNLCGDHVSGIIG